MQPQPSKNNYNGAQKNASNTKQSRSNQSSRGNGSRQQNYSSNTPRNRYIQQPTAVFPSLHPGIVMGQFNPTVYATRPPYLQQYQYPAQFYPQIYYPCYLPQLSQQPQQQPHQPSSNANTIMGVMVQPSTFVSGPAGSQTGLPIPVTANNSVLNVAASTEPTVCLPRVQPTPAQLPYTISSAAGSVANVPTVSASSLQNVPSRVLFASAGLVGNTQLVQTNTVVPQTQPLVKAKLRTHALQIIHPITNKNILQDLNSDKDVYLPVTTSISQIQIHEKKLLKASKSVEVIQKSDLSLNLWTYKKDSSPQGDTKRNFKDATQQAEQISTHDVCVEIVPILENRSKSDKPKENLPTTSSEQTRTCEEKCSDTNLPAQEKPVEETPVKETPVEETSVEETLVVFELEDPRPQSVEPEQEKHLDDIKAILNESLTETVSTDDEYSKTNTDTSSIMEELGACANFENVEIFKNEALGGLCKEESLLEYNMDSETMFTPTDRKQYTRRELMQLRQVKQSFRKPEVKNFSIFLPNNLMPAFATRSSKVVSPGFVNYENCYVKHNARSNRNTNTGTEEASTFGSATNRNKGKPLIYINLSLNQDVQLNEANNAWRPRILVEGSDEASANSPADKNELIRRIRGILNKLTPENFEPLVDEIIKLKIDTVDKMEAVMNLVFEKAIDEPNFSVSYAKLCYRLINEVKASDERMESCTKSNLAYFRNALLDKTEREFTHHVIKIDAKEEKLKPIRERYENCQDSEEKIELETLLEEEERKIRRRSGGTVRFIGELFKISILNSKIIHSCIESLLKDPSNEDMLECLCKLLTTVGRKFEQSCKSQEDKRKYSLKSVIHRMQNIATKSENKISSRVRFMLLDVIDLHKRKWQSTRNEVPQTMQQIEKEINNTNQTSKETLSKTSSQDCARSVKSDQAMLGRLLERGRGGQHDNSHLQKDLKYSEMSTGSNSNKWQARNPKMTPPQALDSSKLMGLANVNMNNKKMGGVSLFQWQKSSSQPQTVATNPFAALSVMESNKSSKPHNPERHKNRMGAQPKNLHNRPVVEHDKGELDEYRLKTRSKDMGGTNSNIKRTQRNQNKYYTDMASTSTVLRRKEKLVKNPGFSVPLVVFTEPSGSDIKLIKLVVTEMLENALISSSIDSDTVAAILRLPSSLKCTFLHYILTDYLHLATVKSSSRRLLSNVVAYLIENKYLNIEHFHLAYKTFAELASDLIVDIPELWLYIFEFTGPLMIKNLINIKNLWSQHLRESGPPSFSEKFLKTFIQYTTREWGPNYMRQIWQKNLMNWSDFLPQKEVDNFIKTNKFQFIENDNNPISVFGNLKESSETLNKRLVKNIQLLLKEGSRSDVIIDYINGNLQEVNRNFINHISSVLVNFALREHKNLSLDLRKWRNICSPVLRYCLNSEKDLQLECLKSIHSLLDNLEHSKGLWDTICSELRKAELISQDIFISWHTSKDQCDK